MEENKKLKVIIVILAFLIVAGIIGFGIFYLEKKSPAVEMAKKVQEKASLPAGEKAAPANPDEIATNKNVPSETGSAAEANKNAAPSKCGHDPQNDPINGDCGEDCNTDNWKVYHNQKYGYSFRYPQGYALTNQCKNANCVSEEEGGDSVFLSGEHILGDWPIINIRHFQNQPYNPPAGANLMEWIKKEFPWTAKCFPDTANIYFTREDGHLFGGFNIYLPASPQAHSRREIYYQYKDKLFQIEMLDVDSPQARQFYNIWLSTFSVIGEN